MNREKESEREEVLSSTSEILDEISRGLSEQIVGEMDQDKEPLTENHVESAEPVKDTVTEKEKKNSTGQKPKLLSLLAGIIGILVLSGFVWVNIYVSGMLNNINFISDEDVAFAKTDITDEKEAPKVTAAPLVTPSPVDSDRVVNILLVGEESVYGDPVGRSDSMMIATINGKQKSLKLTSLMRDIYSAVPGYLPNKLNAAFNNGGGVLLSQTIEQNFGIPLDGYVVVNFDGFEKIVDLLGGVELELTSDEAYYLNTTNYISKPSNRCVSEGKQLMNGNQALGYCRVRYKTASNGESDDFGRTYRQRTVLNSVFDKYKDKSMPEMLDIANQILPFISTNISKADIIDFVTIAASLGTTKLDTFRVPVDHTYMAQNIACGASVGDALTIDYTENIREMKEFIYGSGDGTPKKANHMPKLPDDYNPVYETYGNYGY